MKIISFINQKKGVGKTTIVLNIGTNLINNKKKVLLIDLDPEFHLTSALGINPDRVRYSISSVLRSSIQADKAILKHKSGLSIIPADLSLSKIKGNSSLLKEKMNGFLNFDYILIDTPSNISLFHYMGLVYSNHIYFVMNPDYSSLRLLNSFSVKVRELNRKIDGIIINQYNKINSINKYCSIVLRINIINQSNNFPFSDI